MTVGFTGGKEDYSQFNPRLGFTWQAHPGIQIFGNFSRSFEPPSLVELADSTGKTLDAQEAWTAELGTRGRWHRLSWKLAGYYAWLNDEILIVETPPGTGNFEANNADDTVHAGTELSLTYRQPLGWWGKDALTLQANHTWNEFHFDNAPTFGDNVLPGIPEHVIRAHVTYRHPSGFYLTPSVNAAAGDAFVDFANTLENDSFAIINLRTGFDHPSGWSIFVEGKNLADKEFASNTRVIADASASFGAPAAFNPGRPRSVFAGIEVNY